MTGTIDVWMQHPTLRDSNHDMFDSLRRWAGRGLLEQQLPVSATVAALDEGGVEIGLSAVWYGPEGPLISNDEVASYVVAAAGRLRGVCECGRPPTRRGGSGAAADGGGTGLRRAAHRAVVVGTAAH